ncbi:MULTISPECIES: hypothetical protein [Pseudomonadota]|jgi:hypothetical protein|uniref:hypothetical protein n=1 Tax=Pseudomonadota TaxID=1224 RepID=UPI000769E911|nr:MULTISPECIES: hypothetical protein [Pseudomonadota]MAF60265.1 hypothetical protein [Blastomonas sp.]MBA4778623.1 hypothetical protein [Blastomonas sp.]|tara:strand:- start:82426 stop:82614 length:189 start_codon:yes stop_codon:yes gene_type:complete
MTYFLGFPLLPLWIMGVPLIGALLTLAMPAPKHNTIPRTLRREERVGNAAHVTTAHPTTTAL